MTRQELETLALDTVSNELYYDLKDTIDSVNNDSLYRLIDCRGDYKQELLSDIPL